MIKRLKNFLKSPSKKTVLKNFFSLSILQGLNMVLPLITYPYLIRVLGTESFGLLMFATAVITYFQIFTEYSFNMTGTKEISVHSNDSQKVHSIFNEVMHTKMLLLLISLGLLTLVVVAVPVFKQHSLIYFITFGNVVGLSIFPAWFFQGMQKMKAVSLINIGSKIFFTAGIFVFVKGPQDVWLAALLTACGYIFAGIICFLYAIQCFKLPLKMQPLHRIKQQLLLGKYLFLSELKISLFTNTNTLLLGFIAGNTAVTYFASAEKLARAIGNVFTPLTAALFPFFAKEITIDKHKAYAAIVRITAIGSILFLVGAIPVFIFSDAIIRLIYGPGMDNSVLIFRILLFIPLASFIDNMFGKQVLLTLGKDNLYFRVILTAALSNVLLNLILTPMYSYIGTAIALLITQLIIDAGMYHYARKQLKKNSAYA